MVADHREVEVVFLLPLVEVFQREEEVDFWVEVSHLLLEEDVFQTVRLILQ